MIVIGKLDSLFLFSFICKIQPRLVPVSDFFQFIIFY